MQKTEHVVHPRGGAGAKTLHRLRSLEAQVPGLQDIEGRLEDVNRTVLGFIKRRPGVCLVGALALGFVVARIVRDRG